MLIDSFKNTFCTMETLRVEKRGLSEEQDVKSREPILVKVDKNGDGPHIIHIDKDEFNIGRARDNDEIILSTLISRKHCVLRCEGNGEWSIKDTSSTHTFVNDVVIPFGQKHYLSPGDIVQFSNSDEFKYVFTSSMTDERERKRQKLDEQWFDAALMDQKTFAASQATEKKGVKDQLQTKQKEQVELRKKLEELLSQSTHVGNDKTDLIEGIKNLESQIATSNIQEQQLQNIYTTLLTLENETIQFEERFKKEKLKWQETLNMTKQEKDELEAKIKEEMETWRKQQQEEWKNVMEKRVKAERDIHTQLLNEKIQLEEKLKQTEQALKEQEAKAENMQIVQSIDFPGNSMQDCVFLEVLDVRDDREMHIIDTIDLTDCSEFDVTTSVKENATLDKIGTIMDEQLTCSVCSELFVKATTLNCTHTFCHHCIKSWNKKKKECPVCRAPVKSMNRSIVLDNFIESMMENLPTELKVKRSEIIAERKLLEKKKSAR